MMGRRRFGPLFCRLRRAACLAGRRWTDKDAVKRDKGVPLHPIATALMRHKPTIGSPDASSWRWSCQCRIMMGQTRALERCAGCHTLVVRRAARRTGRWRTLRLPERILHPYRQGAARALLGLTAGELRDWHVEHGIGSLRRCFHEALGDPLALGRARLAKEPDWALRVELGLGLQALCRELLIPGFFARLFIQDLPVPPPALRVCGLPASAPDVVASPLAKAYLQVKFAARRYRLVRTSGVPLLRIEGRRALLLTLDALFGPVDLEQQKAEPRSLADLLCRLWPMSRAPMLRGVVPGTFRLQGVPMGDGESHQADAATFCLSMPETPDGSAVPGRRFLQDRKSFIRASPAPPGQDLLGGAD